MVRYLIFIILASHTAANALLPTEPKDMDLFAMDESLPSSDESFFNADSNSIFNGYTDINNKNSDLDLSSTDCLLSPRSSSASLAPPWKTFRVRRGDTGEFCRSSSGQSSSLSSSSSSSSPSSYDDSVLGATATRDYWCPVDLRMQLEAMSSGFASIPVCDTAPMWTDPSEFELPDWDLTASLTGFYNLLECILCELFLPSLRLLFRINCYEP